MSAGGFITGTKKLTQRCGAREEPAVGGAGAGALHSRKNDGNFFHSYHYPLLLPLPACGEGVGG
jgi:hypothetical protein